MEKYLVVSPGRSGSTTFRNHIKNSLEKKGVPYYVEQLEMPMLWPEAEENPQDWNIVICYRRDMLAQVLSFYTIVLSKQTQKWKDIELEPFVVPRIPFWMFAHGILFFHYRVFGIKEWPKFKSIHWFVYEDMFDDWNAVGKQLGFDDWSNKSEGHAIGYGSVWDKVINKEEVLGWVEELQKHYQFTVDLTRYK